MKIKFILITFLVLISISTTAFAQEPYDTGHIKLLAEEVTPDPVEPGQDLTVKIRLYNDGSGSANRVVLTRQYEYPFKLKSVSQDVIEFPTIAPGGSREETFYITVSPRAKSGIYPLKFNIESHFSDGIFTYINKSILINIIGQPEIILNTIDLKSDISPNSDFDLKLNVENIGTGNARNIKIIPDYEGIGPVGSNIVLVDKLLSGNSSELSVRFKVGENIEPGFYQVPFNIEFTNEKGEALSSSQKIGLNIIHKADVVLQDLKIKPGSVSVGGKISIETRVENIGDGDADNVYIELKSDPKEGLSGFKKAYIGQLEKGDEAPAIFSLTATQANKYNGTLTIHYTDDLGEHKKTENIGFNVNSNPLTMLSWIGGIVLIGILSFFGHKKFSKSKDKTE